MTRPSLRLAPGYVTCSVCGRPARVDLDRPRYLHDGRRYPCRAANTMRLLTDRELGGPRAPRLASRAPGGPR